MGRGWSREQKSSRAARKLKWNESCRAISKPDAAFKSSPREKRPTLNGNSREYKGKGGRYSVILGRKKEIERGWSISKGGQENGRINYISPQTGGPHITSEVLSPSFRH